MARAKAQKIRCHQCGAKNDLEARRCRICTGLLQVDRTTGLSATSGNDPDNFNPDDLWASQGKAAPTSEPAGAAAPADAGEGPWEQEPASWDRGPAEWASTSEAAPSNVVADGHADDGWVTDPTFDPNAPFDPAALVVETWGPGPAAATESPQTSDAPEPGLPERPTLAAPPGDEQAEPVSWGPMWDEPPVDSPPPAPPPPPPPSPAPSPAPSLDDWYRSEPMAPPPPPVVAPPPPDAEFDWDDLPPPPDDDDDWSPTLPPPPTPAT